MFQNLSEAQNRLEPFKHFLLQNSKKHNFSESFHQIFGYNLDLIPTEVVETSCTQSLLGLYNFIFVHNFTV